MRGVWYKRHSASVARPPGLRLFRGVTSDARPNDAALWIVPLNICVSHSSKARPQGSRREALSASACSWVDVCQRPSAALLSSWGGSGTTAGLGTRGLVRLAVSRAPPAHWPRSCLSPAALGSAALAHRYSLRALAKSKYITLSLQSL